ncbi:MAG: aquaporin [Firmicutes bacterium]|nr:aquaporin [Bacillota bacterium]
MKNNLLKKAIAEGFGTFVLVFFAVGTAVVTGGNIVATALAFGLVIVAMAYSIGSISGCHINPAVSLGVLLTKKMTIKDFVVYVVAQFIGAIIAAALLFSILRMASDYSLGSVDTFGFPTTYLAIWGSNGIIGSGATGFIASLILELILTFVFVYVILVVTTRKETLKKAGLIIGLTLTLVHLLGIALTGTSVNPARSFGPALMQLIFGGGNRALIEYWVFLVAPLAGGALAALAFMFFNKKDASNDEVAAVEEPK